MNYWLVGATFGKDDQLDRFLRDNIWENGYDKKYADKVKSIETGDRIAVKSTFTRKNNLPFDNQDNYVSCMRIRAVGTVTDNPKNGKTVQVQWDSDFEPREWFFYTFRTTITQLDTNKEFTQELIRFIESGEEQDIKKFLNDPYWSDRYSIASKDKFTWIPFYKEFANHLLRFEEDRVPLVNVFKRMANDFQGRFTPLEMKAEDGTTKLIEDIDPFTVIGSFNRAMTDENRIEIIEQWKREFSLESDIPSDFLGIPTIDTRSSRFLYDAPMQNKEDVDSVWKLFRSALELEESEDNSVALEQFGSHFKKALSISGIKWNLTQGLFWIRPYFFLSLDGRIREYIRNEHSIDVKKTRYTFEDYWSIRDEVLDIIQLEDSINNIPEFSHLAFTWDLEDKVDKEESFVNEDVKEYRLGNLPPLNQILFGPPGTGKTYNTINLALEILGINVGSDRVLQRESFDQAVKDGRIIFTTFHQSMSYEDFVEGIKPVVSEQDGDSISYSVEPGIFKKLSVEAAFEYVKRSSSKGPSEALDFSKRYDVFIETVQDKLDREEDVQLSTKSGGTIRVEAISAQGNLIVKHPNGSRTYTVSKARLTKLNANINEISAVNNIHDEFRAIIGGSNSSAYWSVLNAIQQVENKKYALTDSYSFDDKLAIVNRLNKEDFKGKLAPNYVLIIDEINRGNVSQILGELITLIEEDKRLGKEEALEVTLPYSKESFGVPPNLYIIGTMNTADRSVEALDTALRRRFTFREIQPQSIVIREKGYLSKSNGVLTIGNSQIDLSQLLDTINERMEYLLNKDHLIGHSDFMKVTTAKDLQHVFQRKIIPLLEEYFYGDKGKLQLVLGKGFVTEPNHSANTDIFADSEYDISMHEDRKIWAIAPKWMESHSDFEKALRRLLKLDSNSNE